MDLNEIRHQAIVNVDKTVNELIQKGEQDYNQYDYCLASHNLYTFLPDSTEEKHQHIYRTFLRNKLLSTNNDFYYTFPYWDMMKEIKRERFEHNLPAIFAIYHFCLGFLYAMVLIRENVDFVVVAGFDGDAMEKIKKSYAEQFKMAKEIYPNNTSRMEVVSTMSKTLFVDLMSKVRNGYSILWAVDWAVSYSDSNVTATVNFLNHELLVPKAMAIFSSLLRVPIIPLSAHYNESYVPVCHFVDIIPPVLSMKDKDKITEVMQKLYDILADNVTKHPEQWQGWFFIHRLLKDRGHKATNFPMPQNMATCKYKLSTIAKLFKIEDNWFIMNVRTGALLEMNLEAAQKILHHEADRLSNEEKRLMYKNGMFVE